MPRMGRNARPELTTMRHCDGLQVMRNCFLCDGSVIIVTDRDKAKSIRDMGQRVARLVPDDMGRVSSHTSRDCCRQKSFWSRKRQGVHVAARPGGAVEDGLVMEEMEKRIADDNRDGVEIDELSGEVLNVGGSWNVVWDLQSTHGTKTARHNYAVHIGMPGHLHPFLIRRYHEISRLWHSFLGKGNPMESWGKRRHTAGDGDGDGQEGRSATWRSAKQEECMHAVMRLEGARHLICVLPTGAGKSVLFMASAVMRGRGTTVVVVVVPFARLIEDPVERAKEKGVDVVHFQPGQVIAREALPYVPRLVMVSADVAVAEDKLFMHIASYRQQLTKLKQLHCFSKPMIMLTATLMKTMERDFREMLLLRPKTPIIRDRTTKKNARYEFVQVGRKEGAVEKATVQAVRQTQTSMTSQERCIVYCKSLNGCRAMAEELACACHHSNMDMAHCREVVERWSSRHGSAVMAQRRGYSGNG
ncbi:P-loop containing nucleoside triphosphate hydrolase protein [Trichoderma sp. SZMC 28013]